ncbi:penicillin acylase family protein [Myxococcota bacterium]|nr:penicillin acylase family protein [Myxococcota bacterium]
MHTRKCTLVAVLPAAFVSMLAACETGETGAGAVRPRVSTDAAALDAASAPEPDAFERWTRFPGLTAPVEIRYDGEGVPHIRARTDLDAFHAAGYAQAADRLFALEMARRAALGTTAEVLGEAGVSGDLQARTFEFARLGRESLDALGHEDPHAHASFVAFAAGIDRYVADIAAGTAALPPELAARGIVPAPFAPEDLMAIGMRILFGFSNTLEYDLLYTLLTRLVQDAPALPIFEPVTPLSIMAQGDPGREKRREPPRAVAGAPVGLDPDALRPLLSAIRRFRADLGVGEGSNGLLVAGSATDTGRPYLLNDSHARLTDPNLMFWSHLSSVEGGGTLDVIGAGFTGVPGVHVGHNRHLAWGATTHFADVTDLFSVPVRDGVATWGAQRVPVATRTETIRVRGEDGEFGERRFELSSLPGIGVFLPDEMLPVPAALVADGRLLLAWPGFGPTTEYRMYLAFDRAASLDDFSAAVGLQRAGMQNWMAATADGIRYETHGDVPDRGPPDGRPAANRVLDASDPRAVFSGAFLPPERFPRLPGPGESETDRPFIATANNDPWGHTLDNDPLDDAFYYGSFYAPGFRAARLTEWARGEVDARRPIGASGLQRLQTETKSTLAPRLLPLLSEAIAQIDTDEALAAFRGRPELTAAAARLATWDGNTTLDVREAALWRVFQAHLSRRVLADDLSLLFEAIDEAQPVALARVLLHVVERELEPFIDGPRAVHLVAALSDALQILAERGDPAYGDLHHGLFRRPDGSQEAVPLPGDDSSLNVAQCHFWRDGALAPACEATAGAVYRLVVGFDADGVPKAAYNVPRGNDWDLDRWRDGVYRPLPFREADVEAATVRRVVLE